MSLIVFVITRQLFLKVTRPINYYWSEASEQAPDSIILIRYIGSDPIIIILYVHKMPSKCR